jgi:lipoate-protein ligase A
MAVDEAILDSYLSGHPSERRPTLRLYGFRPAALSLGKSQAARESYDAGYLRAAGIDLVRRPTGGRAVFHAHERTYAVIGSPADPAFGQGVLRTYQRISQALILALTTLGADVRAADGSLRPVRRAGEHAATACFTVSSAHEITAGGRKLVGSAQLRRRHGMLQHGSIPWRIDPEELGRVLGCTVDGERFTDLRRELGRTPSTVELDRALCRAFCSTFQVELVPGELRPDETDRATRLRTFKHLSSAWVRHGRDTGQPGGSEDGFSEAS